MQVIKSKFFTTALLFLFALASSAQKNQSETDSIAHAFYQQYQFQAVIHLLERDSLSSEQHQLKAKSHEKLGEIDEAIQHFKLALQTKPEDKQLILSLAKSYEKVKDYEGAIEQLNLLIEMDSSNAYFHKVLANTYQKSNEFLYAVATYTKARALNKNDLESALALIDLYLKIGMTEKAMNLSEELLEQKSQNKAVLMAHLKTAYKNKKYSDCIQSANVMFAQKDSNLLLQKIVGIAYFHQKEYHKSIQFLENVINVEKESDILYYYLGISYRETKQYEKAQNALEKSIDYAISDNLESYYTQLAVSYEEAGNHVKAIHFYQAAYKSTRDKILLYHLARNYDTYYQDKSTALDYYERYLESEDTANQLYQNYSKHRIDELKVSKHFELDTVN